MTITIQAVSAQGESAVPGVRYTDVADSPFAMLFAAQMATLPPQMPIPVMTLTTGEGDPLNGISDGRAAVGMLADPVLPSRTPFIATPNPANLADANLIKQDTLAAAASDNLNPAADIATSKTAVPAFTAELQASARLAAGAREPASPLAPAAGDADDKAAALNAITALISGPRFSKENIQGDNTGKSPLLDASVTTVQNPAIKKPLALLKEDLGGLSVAAEARLSIKENQMGVLPDRQVLPSSAVGTRQDLPSTAGLAVDDMRIGLPMDRSKQWGEAFSHQVAKAVERQMESARIHVNPEKLGPIEVSISMHKEQAQIMITAANPQAREILESQLPTLSRMMEQAGLQLADAQVSTQQQGQREQHHPQRQHRTVMAEEAEAVNDALPVESARPVTGTSGLIGRA